ncbi:MAG TPA: tetratricopeptide repeat protein, partial [Phycisphaerae bacterium]|nr:tetratricopeptide repeat protein [Phycisphaerae bacterium]
QSELYQSSRGIWEYVLDHNNHSWVAWDQLSSYDFQTGDIKDGQREAAEAYEITTGRNFYADAVLGVALTNLDKGYTAGMELLEQSRQLNPYQPYFLTRLAINYENHGEKDRALDELRNGLNLMPDNPTLNVAMGEFSGSEGDYQEALEDFDKALEYKPLDLKCMFDDCIALEKLGRNQDALEECRKMLDLYPDDPEAKILYTTLLAKQ